MTTKEQIVSALRALLNETRDPIEGIRVLGRALELYETDRYNAEDSPARIAARRHRAEVYHFQRFLLDVRTGSDPADACSKLANSLTEASRIGGPGTTRT